MDFDELFAIDIDFDELMKPLDDQYFAELVAWSEGLGEEIDELMKYFDKELEGLCEEIGEEFRQAFQNLIDED